MNIPGFRRGSHVSPAAAWRTLLLAAAVAGLALVTAGCDSGTSAGHGFLITNNPDDFYFQVNGLANFTRTYDYDWANTDTLATVSQACSIDEGNGVISIHDATGTLVYEKNLREHGTFTTFAGPNGTWKITLTLQRVSGDLRLRILKSA
jgi:hypothetical protein